MAIKFYEDFLKNKNALMYVIRKEENAGRFENKICREIKSALRGTDIGYYLCHNGSKDGIGNPNYSFLVLFSDNGILDDLPENIEKLVKAYKPEPIRFIKRSEEKAFTAENEKNELRN